MKRQNGYTIVELMIVVVAVIGVIGWVWNIVKIAGSDFGQITGMLILRCVGIVVAPLGAVIGYF